MAKLSDKQREALHREMNREYQKQKKIYEERINKL